MKNVAFRDFLLVIMVVSIWAFNNVAIKLGLMELPPLFLTCMRFFIVSVVIVPFYKINHRDLFFFVLLAFTFGFMHLSLFFVGMCYTDSGIGAVIVQSGTPIAMLSAMFFLGERFNILQIFGVFLSLIGIMVLSGSPSIPDLWVFVLLLCSASGWAFTNLIIKKISLISPISMTGWIAFFSVPMIGIVSWFCESDQMYAIFHAGWRGWFGIFYSAIASSIVAYSFWYSLLKKYNVSLIMPYSLLTPVLAILMSIFILGDTLDYFKVMGTILVIFGTVMAVINFNGIRIYWLLNLIVRKVNNSS